MAMVIKAHVDVSRFNEPTLRLDFLTIEQTLLYYSLLRYWRVLWNCFLGTLIAQYQNHAAISYTHRNL